MTMNILIKWLLLFTLLTLTGTTLFAYLQEDNHQVQIKTLNQTHSYTYTNALKTFTIPVLVNTLDTYYFNKEAITSIKLKNNDEVLPLTLSKVTTGHQQEDWIELYLDFNFMHTQEEGTLNFETASIEITYINQEVLTLEIGEFNVFFHDHSNPSNIVIQAIHNTHQDLGFGMTSTGVILRIYNDSNQPLTLHDVSLNTHNIKAGFSHITPYDKDIVPYMTSHDIIKDYDHLNKTHRMHPPFLIPAYETATLFIPFDYLTPTILYQYPLFLTFDHNQEEKKIIIDDFTFIKRTLFESINQEGMNHYEPSSE